MINYNIKNVNEMSIEELVGQVIMIGLPGKSLDDRSKKLIEKYKIGNFILFARNYQDTVQMKNFMTDLYNYTIKVNNSYPLVSIDQEGGMVVRLLKDVIFPASPLTTSITTVENAPYITGKMIAEDMLEFGINLNLAPCLEINEFLSNPLINVRGYGATKEIVSKNASLFVDGLQDGGVLSCIKHYPGSGSSTKDSHLELPIILESKKQLLNYNMYPFSQILNSDCLMTSHCIYKSFDELPSTLSKVLLHETLREQMSFEGLIISDGMEMKAISDHYGIKEGSVMALNAGCDILLLCHEYDDQVNAFEAVLEAVKNGRISIELLKEKVTRINKAKEKIKNNLIKNFNNLPYNADIDKFNLMQEIVDKSYTLIKGEAPIIKNKTLILSSSARVGSIVEDEFDDTNLTVALRNNFKNVEIIKFGETMEFKNQIHNIIDEYDNFIVYSYDAYKDLIQLETINMLLDTNKNVYVVSIKGISDMNYFTNLKNYSCLFEYTPNSIRTIIKQLYGKLELNKNKII